MEKNNSTISGVDASRPKLNYNVAWYEEDTSPDPSQTFSIDADQYDEGKSSSVAIVRIAENNGLSDEKKTHLEIIVLNHTDIFHWSSSLGPPAALLLLKIKLTMDAKSVEDLQRQYIESEQKVLRSLKNILWNLEWRI